MKAKKVLTLFLVVAILFYIFIQLLPLWRITTIILGFLIFSIGFYRTTAPLVLQRKETCFFVVKSEVLMLVSCYLGR
jgi:hypothetical protein